MPLRSGTPKNTVEASESENGHFCIHGPTLTAYLAGGGSDYLALISGVMGLSVPARCSARMATAASGVSGVRVEATQSGVHRFVVLGLVVTASLLGLTACGGGMRPGVSQPPQASSLHHPASIASTGSPLVWRVVESPNPGGPDGGNVIFGLTCSGPGACWAVGALSHSPAPLVLKLARGSWQPFEFQVGSGFSETQLSAVSCVSPADCWAVGSRLSASLPPGPTQTAIWRFDGHTWRVVSSPDPGGSEAFNVMTSVSCTGPDDCWATGNSIPITTRSVLHSFLLHWNGVVWSQRPLPTPGSRSFSALELRAVTCVSGPRCWLTGSETTVNGRILSLAMVLAAGQWRVVPTPNPGSQVSWHQSLPAGSINLYPNSVGAISCPGPSDCWAAEQYLDAGGLVKGALIHFDGSRFRLVPSPSPLGLSIQSMLGGVSCPARTDCWALEDSWPGTTPAAWARQQVYALHFDGHAWHLVSLPNPASAGYVSPKGEIIQANNVSALSCPTPGTCVAAGWFFDGQLPSGQKTLLLEGTAA